MPLSNRVSIPAGLPESTTIALIAVSESAIEHFGSNLVSLVLFGSAAEARLRTVSDVNILIVLNSYTVQEIDAFREPLRLARIQITLAPMFICREELPHAAEAFAVKFDDITRRHATIYGEDVVSEFTVSRSAMLHRVKQVLLNTQLRLRERYAMLSLRDEQLLPIIVEMASALRSSAATLIELEGGTAPSAREALEKVISSLGNSELSKALANISEARLNGKLGAGEGARTVLSMLVIAEVLQARVRSVER